MILIFTECLTSTGLGHLGRCTAIAEKLVERGEKVELILHSDGTGVVNNPDFPVQLLDWKNTANLEKVLDRERISIVDSYLAQDNVYKIIQKKSSKLVCIDDDMRLDYPEGSTIINPGIIGKEIPYNRTEYTVLSGTEFALLRKPFLEEIKSKIVEQEIQRILITTGGEDRNNLTPSLIGEIRKAYNDSKLLVIVGPFFKNKKEIESAADRNVELLFSPDAKSMRDAMLSSDIAITAGGQTMYELARTGVPMIVFLAAQNQSGNIKGFSNAGCAVNIGRPEDSGFLENLKKALQSLRPREIRAKMSDLGRKLVDGKGAERIVNEISGQDTVLHFRKAEENDVDLYFEWANDPVVRSLSYNKNPILYESHVKWFQNKIKNPNSLMLIFSNQENIPVGQVRIDPGVESGDPIIGVSVAGKFRGKGLGSEIIRLASNHYLDKYPTGKIRACIFSTNQASIQSFTKAGFRFLKEETIDDIPSVVMIKTK